jgi:NAD(P)-dependent dehydrogenase (short-subunit alcohol dehydrogenase family)
MPGARVTAIPTDATDRDAVECLIHEAVAAYGRIDSLVNTVAPTFPAGRWPS